MLREFREVPLSCSFEVEMLSVPTESWECLAASWIPLRSFVMPLQPVSLVLLPCIPPAFRVSSHSHHCTPQRGKEDSTGEVTVSGHPSKALPSARSGCSAAVVAGTLLVPWQA